MPSLQNSQILKYTTWHLSPIYVKIQTDTFVSSLVKIAPELVKVNGCYFFVSKSRFFFSYCRRPPRSHLKPPFFKKLRVEQYGTVFLCGIRFPCIGLSFSSICIKKKVLCKPHFFQFSLFHDWFWICHKITLLSLTQLKIFLQSKSALFL